MMNEHGFLPQKVFRSQFIPADILRMAAGSFPNLLRSAATDKPVPLQPRVVECLGVPTLRRSPEAACWPSPRHNFYMH
jgi:hypothetical protein